jgi:hypothetical protein
MPTPVRSNAEPAKRANAVKTVACFVAVKMPHDYTIHPRGEPSQKAKCQRDEPHPGQACRRLRNPPNGRLTRGEYGVTWETGSRAELAV